MIRISKTLNEGGYWNNGVFAYNRTVNNFGGVAITNVYNKTVINNTTVTRVSFNGGAGGTKAQPTPQEEAVAHEQHVAPPRRKLNTSMRQAPTRRCSPP